jgi:hypothetical protein
MLIARDNSHEPCCLSFSVIRGTLGSIHVKLSRFYFISKEKKERNLPPLLQFPFRSLDIPSNNILLGSPVPGLPNITTLSARLTFQEFFTGARRYIILCSSLKINNKLPSRSQWPRGPRFASAATHLLRFLF